MKKQKNITDQGHPELALFVFRKEKQLQNLCRNGQYNDSENKI